MDRKRTEAIRDYEYDQRRKQWKRRLGHLKALCVVIILSYGTYPVDPTRTEWANVFSLAFSEHQAITCRSSALDLESDQQRDGKTDEARTWTWYQGALRGAMGHPDARQEDTVRRATKDRESLVVCVCVM